MLPYLLVLSALGQVAAANVRPQIGYVYPPGGRAGQTIEVKLGTYDWTPDMQVLSHDPRVKIELTGPAGEPILTPPPYWFGQKAGLVQPPLPREVPAKITLPADLAPGMIHWQVANANGGSNVGQFVVGAALEVVEPERVKEPLKLPSLPVTVSGRIAKITEVDTYHFTTTAPGLHVCRLDDRLGQPFNGLLTILNARGEVVVDSADTIGAGATLMFTAEAGAAYTATVRDVDHAGDRGYVYRLTIERAPRVVAYSPLVVARGATTAVEIVGYGIKSGAAQLETVTQSIAVPASAKETHRHEFDTPAGRASITVAVDAAADTLEPTSDDLAQRMLSAPARISGTLDREDPATLMASDRYQITAKKGDALRLVVEADRYNSSVDPSLAVIDADGKEIVRGDDLLTGPLVTSTDAAVDFKAPADGVYQVIVTDVSGNTPSRASVYRLTVDNPEQLFDFALTVPERLDIPLGGQVDLIVKSVRRGTWDDPITIRFEGLPEGATLPETPPPPAAPPTDGKKPRVKKPVPGDIKLTLTAADNVAAGASLATVIATAKTTNDAGETRTVEHRYGPLLVSTTLKTRCKVKSAVQDGGRIVNRGTTYPADVIIERLDGYEGPITLQMAATQQRQRRGICGRELVVPAGVDTVQYPVFMPEWLETSLTARINVIGVAQVPDPKGNVRHITGIMDGLIVMSLEGALLKLTHEPAERTVTPGSTIEIPLKVSRTVKLPVAAKVELIPDENDPQLFTAETLNVPASQGTGVMKVRVDPQTQFKGERQIVIRATAMQDGKWPAVSETRVSVWLGK